MLRPSPFTAFTNERTEVRWTVLVDKRILVATKATSKGFGFSLVGRYVFDFLGELNDLERVL